MVYIIYTSFHVRFPNVHCVVLEEEGFLGVFVDTSGWGVGAFLEVFVDWLGDYVGYG